MSNILKGKLDYVSKKNNATYSCFSSCYCKLCTKFNSYGDNELDIIKTSVSQNFRPRGGKKVEALVLHCVGLSDDWVLKNYVLPSSQGGLGVSAHYYIPQCGRIYQLVPETESAFHAGVSEWRNLAQGNGLKGLNDLFIGIEFQSLGYAQLSKEGYFPYCFTPFQETQIGPGISLSQQIMSRTLKR